MANLAGGGQALDSSLNTIYSEFLLLRDEKGVCRKCATHHSLKAHQGASKNILNYGRLAAYNLSDGVDMVQAQSLSDSNTAVTPSEVGVQLILPKTTLRRVADPELLRRSGRLMNNAYDLKEDSDGTAQFTSFVPLVGGAGTVIGVGHIFAAAARVSIGNDRANPEPYDEDVFGILHPLMLNVIAGRLVPLTDVPQGSNVYTGLAAGATVGPGRTSMSDEILRRGPKAAGMLSGVEMYRDANIAVDSSDDCSGAVFAREGLIYCTEVEPYMDPDENDASLRGIELNLVGSYGWTVWRSANTGVETLGDASLPTS